MNSTRKILAAGIAAVILTITTLIAPSAAMAAEPALIPTDGLISLGITGTHTPPPITGQPSVEYDRFMPVVRDSHISGLTRPETGPGIAPDEPLIDLRSLAGQMSGPPGAETQYTSYQYTADGALCAAPGANVWPGGAYECPVGGGFMEPLDWAEYAWDIEMIGHAGLVNSANTNGLVTVVPFDEHAEFGIRATLRHIATGITAVPAEIVGYSGANTGGTFDWIYGDQRHFEGGVAMWEAHSEAGWRDNRFLSWANPAEVISPEGAPQVQSITPQVEPGVWGSDGFASTPAGFGLTEADGVVQVGVGGNGVSHRVGQIHGEPQTTVTFDLAASIPGVTAVALPSAPDGVLTLDPRAAWQYQAPFAGVDYQAPGGLTLTASGTTVTATFGGDPEWLNRFGLSVFVLRDGAVEMVEIRSESLPFDTVGGLVEKEIPVDTEVFVSDDEMLAAATLSGLEPTMKSIAAMDLPAGVERVAEGFLYAGSSEPTEVTFGYLAAETFTSAFGPVAPDAQPGGEVRIAVVPAAVEPPVVTPPVVTPPVVTPPVVMPPVTAPPVVAAPPVIAPRTDGNEAQTGDEGFVTAKAPAEAVASLAPVSVGGIYAVALAIGLGLLLGAGLGRRKRVKT